MTTNALTILIDTKRHQRPSLDAHRPIVHGILDLHQHRSQPGIYENMRDHEKPRCPIVLACSTFNINHLHV